MHARIVTFLRRTPLRVKLVASVVVLIIVALAAIGAASSFALRSYLVGQIDRQLTLTSHTIDINTIPRVQAHGFIPPTNYLVAIADVHGIASSYSDPALSVRDLPPMPTSLAQVEALVGKLYTKRAMNGSRDWRMLVTALPNGQLLVLGQSLSDVEGAEHRLMLIELIVGSATLVVSTVLGVALVRASLRPLDEIEDTAAAIATGDLTRRVPDFEPPGTTPKTEVGHLGQALNVMLAQIEGAFAARTESEVAARHAESAARAAADAAQRSEGRAKRSEERMRQFAADASHELRTPLTTIRGFAELYRQGAARAPEETARLIRRIEDEAARMGLLVEDMLLLARLDQERPLANAPVDLRVLGSDAVVSARAIAPGRRIHLEVAPGTGPLLVMGDELRLRQVVTNLMTNAMTYAPGDTPIVVRLDAGTEPAPPVAGPVSPGRGSMPTGFTGGYAELAVIDQGPGLDAVQAERVFERFYRVDSARTRKAAAVDGLSSGNGLGLAIVAALVAAHGGTVDVTSSPGRGATFRVRLPRSSGEVPSGTSTPVESSSVSAPPVSVAPPTVGAAPATDGSLTADRSTDQPISSQPTFRPASGSAKSDEESLVS